MIKKSIKNPHDKLFRAAMSDLRVAKDFLETYLPAAVQVNLDLTVLELQPTTHVDRAMRTVHSDVLYRTQLKAASDGESKDAYLYVLLEHQSTVDPLMPFRIWQYLINIWATIINQKPTADSSPKPLPLIVPIVFYSGKGAYDGPLDLRELIAAPSELVDITLFQHSFQLIDVTQMSDEVLQQSQWAGMLALVLKHGRHRDIVQFLKGTMELFKVLEHSGGTDFVQLLLHYCLNTGETIDIQAFVETVQQGLSTETGEKIMTIAEQFKAKGKIEGENETLNRIATNGFKKGLDFSLIQQLTGLSEEKLKEVEKSVLH